MPLTDATDLIRRAAVQTLNQPSRPIFENRVVAPFVLDAEGQQMVTRANQSLDSGYVDSHDFPRPAVFFDLVVENLNRSGRAHFNRAIDVCCGTGFLALELTRRGIIETCLAVDINRAAITILQEKLKATPSSRVEPTHANFLSFSPKEKVDLIIGNSFLHHFPDNRAFLLKCHELLNQGGVLFLCHEPSLLNDFLENPISYLLTLLGRRKSVLCTDIWQYSVRSATELLQSTGFTHIEIRGFSLLSSPFNWLVLTIWKRVLRAPVPRWAWGFFFRLTIWEQKLFFFIPKDWFASFMITARAE